MSVHTHRPSRARSYADSSSTAVDWRTRSLCRYEDDPEVFHPAGSASSAAYQRRAEIAKEICRRCDVVERCLNWALDEGITDGVWGGADEAQRRAMLSGKAPRTVPLAPWRVCARCGEKKVPPTSKAQRPICQTCKGDDTEAARLRKLRVRPPQQPAPAPLVAVTGAEVDDTPTCRRGHRLTPDNTYRDGDRRRCVACRKFRNQSSDAIAEAARRVLLASRGELAS